MNMTAEEMLFIKMLPIIGLVLLGVEALIGTVANGFIVLVNCRDWFRTRKMSPIDQILSCLALSRLTWQSMLILTTTLTVFFEDNFKQVHLNIFILWIFIDAVNLWFAGWLSCLYFSKIAVFSHPIFLQVKRRFSGLVPQLLLGSVIFSAFMTIILGIASTYSFPICIQNVPLPNNRSSLEMCTFFAFVPVIPNLIPIMIFLSSTTLLIISLQKHIRRVQHSGVGVQDLNTHVHLTAIKALGSFAILYLSSFAVGSIESILIWRNSVQTRMTFVFHNVSALYSTGHAVILIRINPKLKQAWFRMLHHLKCGPNQAQS